MTDRTTKARPTNSPSHRLFNVTGASENNRENARWTDIGVAWSTKDGPRNTGGFTLALNAIPVNGRIVMREGVDKPTANKKGS
jgi:hypothetical protein